MVGAQQFGVAPVQEEGVDLEGMVPVPPKVDHQTDTAMIDIMREDAPRLVERLKHLIDQRKREDWYQIFLTMFIVLNNIEFLLRRQELFLEDMRAHDSKLHAIVQPTNEHKKNMMIAKRCIKGSESLISNFTRSADQILVVYRLYALSRRVPFAVKRTAKDLKEASLHPHEIAYVESMQADGSKYMDSIGHKPHRLAFISRLLSPTSRIC